MRYQKFFIWGFVLLLLGCGTAVPVLSPANPSNSSGGLEGRILVWHDWEGQKAAVLESQINTFRRLHPDVTIVVTQLPAADLLPRYTEAARLGLGPDILLGQSEWLTDLLASKLIRDVSAEVQIVGRYMPSGVDQLREEAGIYGVPLIVRPSTLYYNQALIKNPATTLEELRQHASEGHVVALSTRAESAYWGITAFGAPLFGQDASLTADTSGLVGWLNWLKAAQDNPNVILSQDEASLERLFAEGRAAYYVGRVDLLPHFQAGVEEDSPPISVGVAPLPNGEQGNARPLVEVDTLYFNTASSPRQYALSLALADFLTNVEQSTMLLRELGVVPANQRVRINNRLYPAVAIFAQQGRQATAVPKSLRPLVLGEVGDGLYTAVLSGARSTDGAVCEFLATLRHATQGGELDLSNCPAD